MFRVILDGIVVGLVTGLVGAGRSFLVVPALLGGRPMPVQSEPVGREPIGSSSRH